MLLNKFGLTDRDALAKRERRHSQIRELELRARPDIISPDLTPSERISATHRHLFQDVYDWAGEYRTDGIAKRPDEPFMAPERIPEAVHALDEHLATAAKPMREEPIRFLAAGFARLNYVHPYLDGNGRTQREFWRHFASQHGYLVDWSSITPEQHQHASRRAYFGDHRPLEDVFQATLRAAPPQSQPRGSGPRGPQPRIRRGVPGAGRWTFNERPDDPTVHL
ncbi:Fic/DOC family protein [Curtobacterium citreum]